MVDGVTQRITFSERRVKMKYKIRDGGFSTREILDKVNTSCEKNAFIDFVSHFGSKTTIAQGTSYGQRLLSVAVAKEKEGWIDWLIINGFIKEDKPEQTFYLGQMFWVTPINGESRGLRCIFMIARSNPNTDLMHLVCVEGKVAGSCWKYDPVQVNNPYCISYTEFDRIIGPKRKVEEFTWVNPKAGRFITIELAEAPKR